MASTFSEYRRRGFASTVNDLIDWFKTQYTDKRSIFWGISIIDRPDIIGFYKCEIEVPKVRADLGYDLNAEYWNKGILTESLGAIVDFVFHSLSINRIEAAVSTKNTASEKVLEKLGFVKEGVLRERSYLNGACLVNPASCQKVFLP